MVRVLVDSPARPMAKLRAIRLLRAMTQEELSQKAAVSQANISRIENGPKHVVSLRVARRLARALRVQLHEVDEFRPTLGLPPLPPESAAQRPPEA